MLIKFVYGAGSRTFFILCCVALVVGPCRTDAMTRHQVSGAPGCTHYIGDDGTVRKYQGTANFLKQTYDNEYTGDKRIRANTYKWEQMLRMQNTTTDCPAVQKKVEEFFRIAIQKNNKSCAGQKKSNEIHISIVPQNIIGNCVIYNQEDLEETGSLAIWRDASGKIEKTNVTLDKRKTRIWSPPRWRRFNR